MRATAKILLFVFMTQPLFAQKWQQKTLDGKVTVITNQGGQTLGYSQASGVSILTVDGLAFKDLNRNGKLDIYED